MRRKDIKTLNDLWLYYKSIPKSRWIKYNFVSIFDRRCHCAVGHLGVQKRPDLFKNKLAANVASLFMVHLSQSLSNINDWENGYIKCDQKHPKDRVLKGVELLIKKLGADYDILEDDYRWRYEGAR